MGDPKEERERWAGEGRERERGHTGRREEEKKSRVCVVCESRWPMKRN